ALGSEAIRTVPEVLFEDGLQHFAQGVLDDLVLERRDAQRPCPAVPLGDVDPSDRLMTPAPGLQPLVPILQVGPQVLPVALLRVPIHACRRFGPKAVVGAGQRPVHRSGEPALPQELTHAVSQAALTVTVNDASKVYGTANPAFSVHYDGFVLNEG